LASPRFAIIEVFSQAALVIGISSITGVKDGGGASR
jgi:hypothetical protein